METIINAINLLKAVRSTMDTIEVRGIENQDKFVGCANAVLTAAQTLEKFVQDHQTKAGPNEGAEQEDVNGR